MAHFLLNFEVPHILEIGIDRGQTMVPLLAHMLRQGRPFKYIAIDLKVSGTLVNQLDQMPGIVLANHTCTTTWNVMYININSTEFLKEASSCDYKFDLILHDGDHNYAALSNELPLVQQLMHPASMLYVDDFNGRYAERDLFYSDRPGYEKLDTNKKIEIDGKSGVQMAVKEWYDKTSFNLVNCPDFEPCWLYDPQFVKMNSPPNDYVRPMDSPRDIQPLFFGIDPAYKNTAYCVMQKRGDDFIEPTDGAPKRFTLVYYRRRQPGEQLDSADLQHLDVKKE